MRVHHANAHHTVWSMNATKRDRVPNDALRPARGLMIGLGISAFLWAGLISVFFW
ncbi:hypothetical protein [Antarcticirhabdus aurantiaca]|uniref:Uncharacterized protein n=1 Tax=Antarcticirhabdus aurantiaca TaxID=2606717 RepID=A0ACD4NQZ1_9HYPH|nr:hypothetical protein [Antarcticirhabdus aurantiaca]WAJ29163.1 hypothetical protein OXU80_02655 [Jeongeuplla avenae]